MMKISITKIDDKGRITLPTHFLKANGIKKGSDVIIEGMVNNNSVKLKFGGIENAK